MTESMMKTKVGTPQFMAPEILVGKPYSLPVSLPPPTPLLPPPPPSLHVDATVRVQRG